MSGIVYKDTPMPVVTDASLNGGPAVKVCLPDGANYGDDQDPAEYRDLADWNEEDITGHPEVVLAYLRAAVAATEAYLAKDA
jgi:hypothetical protein